MTLSRLGLHRSLWSVVLALASCGGDDDTDTGGATTTSTSASSTSASSTSASSTSASSSESTGASTSVGTSATADTGASESSTGTAPTTESTGAAETDTGATTGGAAIIACTADPQCPDGYTCRLSLCCDGAGFCALSDAPNCGGFVGTPCEAPQVCVTDVCVGDGDGRCLDPDDAAELDAAQPACWNVG